MNTTRLLLIFCVLALCFDANAQKEVKLNINHFLGGSSFAFNQNHSNDLIEPIQWERMEYYLSNFRIVHDGGQVIYMDDVWLLVDAGNDSIFSLGSFNGVTNIEALRFAVGVNPEVNHLDPSTYAADHPLAHQLPSMHWGWTSGYRFIAIEAVELNNNQTVEVHTIGDELYDSLSISPATYTVQDTITMEIYADYAMALWGVNFQGGLISHGALKESKEVTSNFINHVFSVQQPTAIVANEEGQFHCYPNPAKGKVYIDALITDPSMKVKMLDVFGKTINFDQTQHTLTTAYKGVAIVQLIKSNHVLNSFKIVFE